MESDERQPAWFVVVLGLALALFVAAASLFLLQALGVDRIGTGFVVLVCAFAAVIGGFLARSLAAKLPSVRRPR